MGSSRKRLINAKTRKLELPPGNPRYAIVSHRWGDESEEVLFAEINDMNNIGDLAESKRKGYQKVIDSCSQASKDDLPYVWLDTCCINRDSEKELTSAIQSMYEWYHEAEVCYAYLHDIEDISQFTESEWFCRGWTLQELVAPRVLRFFTRNWDLLGTRDSLIDLITERTRIKPEVFGSREIPCGISIAQRMRWATGRETTEEEDGAYSLLGLFGIHMSAIYGIKQKAFQRLQRKIISHFSDNSVFAWEPVANADNRTGLLAASPSRCQYLDAHEIPCDQFYNQWNPSRAQKWKYFSWKNGVVCITLPIRRIGEATYEALLRCSLDPPQHPRQRPLILSLKQEKQHDPFLRVHRTGRLQSWEEGDFMASFIPEKVSVTGFFHATSCGSEPHAQALLPIPQHTDSCVAPPPLGAESHDCGASVASEGEVAPSPSSTAAATHIEGLQSDLVNASEKASGDEITHSSARNATQTSDATDIEDWAVHPPFQHLPVQHPPGSKTVNIIVCGEPGAGVGDVVNLIVGRDVVDSRAEFKRPPMAFTTYDVSLDSKNVRIFYTVGPRDHLLDVEGYHTAITNAKELARSLCDDGGAHLLLCCLLWTKLKRNIHRLFYEGLCDRKVPVIVLVTHFAGLGKNSPVDLTGFCCHAHASISVVRPRSPEMNDDYKYSMEIVRKLAVGYTGGSQQAYLPHIHPSMQRMLKELKEFMSTSAKRTLTQLLSIESMCSSPSLSNFAQHSSPSPHRCLPSSSAPKPIVSVDQDMFNSPLVPTNSVPQIKHEINDLGGPLLSRPSVGIPAQDTPIQPTQSLTLPSTSSAVLQCTFQLHGLTGSDDSVPSHDVKGKKRTLASDADIDVENTRPHKRAVSWPSHDPMHTVHIESDVDPGINYLAFSPDGQRLAVICNDCTIRIWNMSSKVEAARLGQNMQMVAVAWMSDSMGVVSLGQDGVISKWTPRSQRRWQCAKLLDTGREDSICFAYKTNRIAVVFPRMGVEVWIWHKGTWQRKRPILRQDVTSVQFVKDGEALIGVTSDGALWYCQVPNGTPHAYASLEVKAKVCRCHLNVNEQGTHALVSQAGGRAHLVGIQQTDHRGTVEQVYSTIGDASESSEQQWNFGAVFASDYKTVLFGLARGNLLVWDKSKGEVVCGLDHGESEQVQAVACINHGSQACIVTGTKRGILSWWKPPLTES